MKTYVVKINDIPLFVEANATYRIEDELPLGVPPVKEWSVNIEGVYCEQYNIKNLLKADVTADIAQNIVSQEEQRLQCE